MSPEDRLLERRARAAGEWSGFKAAVHSEIGLRLEALAWPVLIAGLAIGMEAASRLVGRTGGSTEI